MPHLIAPDPRVRESFVQAQQECVAEGEASGVTLARELAEYGDSWHTESGFARYLDALREESEEEGRRPEGFVPATWWWYVEGDTYLGRIQVRHRLTPFLREFGGHIGYGVRPTARRRGHATAMLRDVLPYARELGLERVLVTCDASNTGSRKAIDANGGVGEGGQDGTLRYWVATQARIRDGL
ncbi:GNAT family N-acetyltransferase [Streptomyces sp. TRM66268-LWL]|uniref:GNAT family N-acetyltransferase n=1 Tax=Streptomyces polyasparticus TaxID=2767826 RepID=A0ABR7SP03_9ACTN|nr:GNAT family N-acetyltransferase [Streptomyces polyasparticus]MBC9716307.1 GNAT family N-acetyltransferase [Streptomyces polyasparticus]